MPLQDEKDAVVIEGEDDVAQYAALLEQQAQAQADMRAILTRPRYALPFLQPGRLVSVLTQPDPPASGASGAEAESDAATDRVQGSNTCFLTQVPCTGVFSVLYQNFP